MAPATFCPKRPRKSHLVSQKVPHCNNAVRYFKFRFFFLSTDLFLVLGENKIQEQGHQGCNDHGDLPRIIVTLSGNCYNAPLG